MDVDIEYEFNLTPETSIDYQCSKHIVEWLQSNMSNITDSNNKKLFSKVNYGYNQDTLKGFGKKLANATVFVYADWSSIRIIRR